MASTMILSSQDLWRSSSLSLEADDGLQSLFPPFHLDTGSVPIPFSKSDTFLDDHTFSWPLLIEGECHDVVQDSEADHWLLPSARTSPKLTTPVNEDIWSLNPEPAASVKTGQLATWEAFHSNASHDNAPFCLSEAGPGVFDAFVQQREKTGGVLPRDVALKACFSLVLGRESVFFTWSETEQVFGRALEDVTASGLSTACTDSVLRDFMQIGGEWRRLTARAQAAQTGECVAMVAFKTCIVDVLEGLEVELTREFDNVESMLQLQDTVERPSRVLYTLEALMNSIGRASNDVTVISATADTVTDLAERGDHLSGLMREVLTVVCAPWLAALARELHLDGHEQLVPISHAGDELESSSELMSFLPVKDQQLIRSTRASIRALREKGDQLNDRSGRFDRARSVDIATARGMLADGSRPTVCQEQLQDIFALPDDAFAAFPSATAITNESAFDGQLQAPLKQDRLHIRSTGLQQYTPAKDDLLHAALVAALADDSDSNEPVGALIYMGFGVDLLQTLRPRLEKQASLARERALSLVFNTHRLGDHLGSHRAFHFFGNGDFATRLTTALFSDDVQTAERRRGVVPNGQTMGLQLGSRESQRWPPASSELRLTLMGVLADSHFSVNTSGELPGGLSFAIRELTESEIDQVMDTTSIHALDFLKLQYTPPEALAGIFTPAIMHHYDSIFRTLLVHIRLLHTTAQLVRTAATLALSTASKYRSIQRFAWQARHFVTTITSHFMHVVIAGAWQRFTITLDDLAPSSVSSKDTSSNRQCASIEDISQLHATSLEHIRTGVFLRRKHENIRHAIEEALQVILKGSLQVLHGASHEVRDVELHMMQALGAVMHSLAAEVEKPVKGRANLAEQENEREAMQLLLAGLDWQRKHT
ncbi:hypothetical protein LTR95_014494 [Oleoguttula sp. CCFEE 5521]